MIKAHMERMIRESFIFQPIEPLVRAGATLFHSAQRGRSISQRYDILRKLYQQTRHGLPAAILFETVSVCILDCEFCIVRDIQVSKYRRKTTMTFDDFKKIVDDIAWFIPQIIFSGGGEPLVNKDIFKMLRYARDKNIITQLNTNGQLLDKDNNLEKMLDDPPDLLLLAYESSDPLIYETTRRRGSFDKLTQNIKALIDQKKARRQQYPIIKLQMVLTKKTLPLVDSFWTSVESLGADYGGIKPLGVWPEGSPEYEKLMAKEYVVPKSEHPISRHEIDTNGNIVWSRRLGQCPAVRHALIGSGGEIIPCYYILTDAWSPGNAIDTNFVELWNSQPYQKYRHKMVNDWAHPLCKKCIAGGAREDRRFR